MKNSANLTVILTIFLSLILACGGGKPVSSKYQGHWNGSDGSTIYMEGDGGAGFKFGSKSVDGGGAVLDESAKTLTISLMGISNTWKIEEEPNDQGEMKLSGVIYRKQ